MIGVNSFNNITSLTGVSLPNSLKTIRNSAFYRCVSLNAVNIPEGVSTIEVMAFSGCNKLVEVELPGSVKNLGSFAFSSCIGLKRAVFAEGITNTSTYTFKDCGALEEVVLPSTLTQIGGFVFQGCKALKEVVIPAKVTKIGAQAFKGCVGLSKITSHATTPATVLAGAFDDVDKNIPVIVPTGTVDDHKAADGWKEFFNIQDGSTGIEGTSLADAVKVQGNCIVLNEVQQVAVYSITGALVYQGYTDSITIDNVGLYIVKIAAGAVKAIIR